MWLGLWNALRIDWQTNAQYAFAMSVPAMAVCFCFLRWNTRHPRTSLTPAEHRAVCAVLVGMIALYIPLRLVEEANGEWRMLFWIWELVCVGVSLGWLALAGGWRWAGHFAFPILFTATAVPWPRFVEDRVIQALAHGATVVTITCLNGTDIPAVHVGNLIYLNNFTAIGVSEACSGMRTFQTSLMLAFVAGELWMLPWKKRALMLLVGGMLSFFFNSARVFFLSLIAARVDRNAFENWHDTLGWVELALCISSVMLAAWCLRNRRPAARAKSRSDAPAATQPAMCGKNIPAWLMVLTLAALILGEVATAYWYRNSDTRAALTRHWTVHTPEDSAEGIRNFKMHEIPEWTRALLRTNDGMAFSWSQGDGLAWYVTYLSWPAGRTSAATAAAHHPDVCLPANGFEYIGDKPSIALTAHGIPMLFHHYLFGPALHPMHVFYSLSEPGGPPDVDFQSDLTMQGRFRAVMAGRRNAGRAVFELLLNGAENDDSAIEALRRTLDKLVTPLPAGGGHENESR